MSSPKLTKVQKLSLEIVSKVGCINEDKIKDLGLNNHTLSKMCEFGYLTKESFKYKGENHTIYRPDTLGKKYINNHFDRPYHTQSKKHDYELCNQYSKLNEVDRNNVITERQCYDLLLEKIDNEEDYYTQSILREELHNNQISCPDLMVCRCVNDVVEYECIEVITSSYTREQIQSKVRYCEVMGSSYTSSRI